MNKLRTIFATFLEQKTLIRDFLIDTHNYPTVARMRLESGTTTA